MYYMYGAFSDNYKGEMVVYGFFIIQKTKWNK